MRRLAQRDVDDLLELAGRGGIGQATALTDCVAEGPDQLMYMTDDVIVLLRDEGDEFLAFCEGEVGWVKRRNLALGACASSSSPTSSSFLNTPGDFHDLQNMNLDGLHDNSDHDHSYNRSSVPGAPPAAIAAVKQGARGGRYSGPFELESSHYSHDEDSVRSPSLQQDTFDSNIHYGPLQPAARLTTGEGVHARTTSDTSTVSSAYSSGSGPIGGLVLGGSSQNDHPSPSKQVPFAFSPFGSYASTSPPSSNALPQLRSLSAAQNMRSVQRGFNYTTTTAIKRQSLQAETARCESTTSSECSRMGDVLEGDEDTSPVVDTRLEATEEERSKSSPSPPIRPPRRRPVDLSIVRNSQLSDTSTARVSDSPAPQTPRSLDTFGGEGLRSREMLVSPDRSIKSGDTRHSETRTSYVGGMFSSDSEDVDRMEALLSPRVNAGQSQDDGDRFSLAYLRDSYASSDPESTPRPDRFESPLKSNVLPRSVSPAASSDSFEHYGVPRLRTTPSQDGTEETVLSTPQSAPVSSFGKQPQPRVMGSQSSELSALAAPLAIDESPMVDHLDKQGTLPATAGGFNMGPDSPTSLNSRYSVESQAAAQAALRDNFYALGHSPHIASKQQQSWKELSASQAASAQQGSPASVYSPPSASEFEHNPKKDFPRPPQTGWAKHTPPLGQPGRKASLDAIRSPRSDERHRMVFTSQSNNDAATEQPVAAAHRPIEERLDDRSSHGWSHSTAFIQQRQQVPVNSRPTYSHGNGSASQLVEVNGNASRFNCIPTPPIDQSPWAQQCHQPSMPSQRPQPTPVERKRPTTPDQRALPNGNFTRRIVSPTTGEDRVQVVARPLDAFQQPARNLAPEAKPSALEYGKLSLSANQFDSRPPVPAFHDQPSSNRGGTPTSGSRSNTPTFTPNRARSRSFSAAIAKTIGRSRKGSFDMPMPRPVVDTERQRSASPALGVNTESTLDPPQTLQLPTARLRPGYASQSSVRAIHHMPIDGDPMPFEPPQQPFLGSHSRSASSPRPSTDSMPRRPSTSTKGQYGVGVSHRDYADPTVKTEGMEFQLLQPRKTADGAPMVSLQLETTDLNFSGLLSSSGSESSHGLVQSSDHHHLEQSAPPAVDEWGFIKECSPTPVIFHSRQPASVVRAAEQKWLEIIAKPIPYSGAPKKVRRLVIEQGVPASLRGRVWEWFMSNGLSGRVNGLFSRLLTNEPGEYDDQINRDVARVYCDHGAFWRQNSPGQQDLRTLLRAYVHFAPSGYRSELALIAGALLIHSVMEDAFWLLAGLFNGTLKTYYVKDKGAFKVDLHVFAGILAGSEPKLANLFRDIGVAPQEYLRHWWMSLYIRSLPWPTVMRFLDALISEGPRYMFISALAVLTLSRDRLLALPRNKAAVLHYLGHLPQDSLLLPDNFMRACDAVKLREDDLKKMRSSVKERISTGMA